MSDYSWLETPIGEIEEPGGFSWLEPGYEVQTTRQLKNPRKHARQVQRRELINGLKRQALTALIPALPPPDVDLYVIGNGSGAEKKWKAGGIDSQCFDFGTFLPHIVKLLGNRDCTAYVSTWTMNRNHAANMLQMLDDGRLKSLTIATDPYFQRREAAIAATLLTGIQRHEPASRYIAFKNHVKALCIADAAQERFCTVTGSANLSAQPRCEQYTLTTAPEVYHFFVDEFFNAIFEGKRSR